MHTIIHERVSTRVRASSSACARLVECRSHRDSVTRPRSYAVRVCLSCAHRSIRMQSMRLTYNVRSCSATRDEGAIRRSLTRVDNEQQYHSFDSVHICIVLIAIMKWVYSTLKYMRAHSRSMRSVPLEIRNRGASSRSPPSHTTPDRATLTVTRGMRRCAAGTLVCACAYTDRHRARAKEERHRAEGAASRDSGARLTRASACVLRVPSAISRTDASYHLPSPQPPRAMASAAVASSRPAASSSSAASSSGAAASPSTVGIGIAAYYQSQIDSANIVIADKTQDLRRLEAQRNDINAKGQQRRARRGGKTNGTRGRTHDMHIRASSLMCVLPYAYACWLVRSSAVQSAVCATSWARCRRAAPTSARSSR
jgi:hypothetical protein